MFILKNPLLLFRNGINHSPVAINCTSQNKSSCHELLKAALANAKKRGMQVPKITDLNTITVDCSEVDNVSLGTFFPVHHSLIRYLKDMCSILILLGA